ncbi:hypothetical protein OIU85_002397 [Salix viminalis]|uniref:DC-UbP/UBTD2 N-terminal domain-containing protein n=1 Tax=Salix viminalis TaxID=40686 RepID=A0A9Q0VNN7_SALVM|nr:hypothetical protein OIU85_002397 [Salix viminalis]
MTGSAKKIRKPKPWKHPQPITKSQLIQMREEFWDTSPHYGGRKEIWDALQAAAEAELSLAQAIVDSAGVIIQNADLTVCYDERGAKYELPKHGVKVKELDYVLPKTTEIKGVILANRKGILGQPFFVQDHRFMGSSVC